MTNKNKKRTTTPVSKRIHRHAKLAVVPHRSNQYRPHAVRRYGIAVIVLFVMLVQGVYNGATSGNVLGVKTEITLPGLLDATNSARATEGLSELRLNKELIAAAELKANDMFKQQYWAHTAPDGTTPWHWFGEVGYSYADAGENLAKNFTTSDSVLAAWLQSPTHRANVLKDVYNDVGFAVASGTLDGKATTIVVALYGTPATAAVQGQKTHVSTSLTDQPIRPLTQFGIGLMSLTPAAIGGLVLLLLGANIALIAHIYRQKLPVAKRRTWYKHHGVYKTAGFVSLAVIMIMMYGSGGQL